MPWFRPWRTLPGMEHALHCPKCGAEVISYRNPAPTTDVVIYDQARGVVLIERGGEPYGFALPGGFIDDGESAEHAAVREMREETALDVELTGLLGVYSRPDRDPRRHTLSVVFTGRARNPEALCAGDDARAAAFYPLDKIPEVLAFDHATIIDDFREVLRGARPLGAVQPTLTQYAE